MSTGAVALVLVLTVWLVHGDELPSCAVVSRSLVQSHGSPVISRQDPTLTWRNLTLIQVAVANKVLGTYAALSSFTVSSVNHVASSFGGDLLVFLLISLILGGIAISVAAYVTEKARAETGPAPAFTRKQAGPQAGIEKPDPSLSESSRKQRSVCGADAGRVLALPHASSVPNYPALCPSLVNRSMRYLTCDFTVPLRGERQEHTWQILEGDEVLLNMRLDELEDAGMSLEKPDRELVGLVRTNRLHLAESHARPPEIHSADDCLFANISKDHIHTGTMLLPDQLATYRERYSLKSASGHTLFRLEGMLQEQRLVVYDGNGRMVAVVYGEGPRIIEMLPGMDPAFMVCAFFGIEKLRLVVRAASGLRR